MARNQNRLIKHLARPALRWTGFFIPAAYCALRSGLYFLSSDNGLGGDNLSVIAFSYVKKPDKERTGIR